MYLIFFAYSEHKPWSWFAPNVDTDEVEKLMFCILLSNTKRKTGILMFKYGDFAQRQLDFYHRLLFEETIT